MAKLTMVLAGLLAAVFAFGSFAGVSAQAASGTVTVIHGVPGLAVDVYVNGDLTLEDFQPDDITDPLELPEGEYDIEIFAAGDEPGVDSPAITGSATLPAGANATIIAHLAEDATPTLSVFVNDTSEIASGEARLVVRHAAAAPAVDVLAGGSALFTGLANSDGVMANVPAGDYSVAVAATGTTDPVIGPVDLTLDDGVAYFVHAVGSLEDGNLSLLVQTIEGLGAAPPATAAVSGLPAAGAGDVTDEGTSSNVWLALALGLFGIAVVSGSAAVAVRARNR